MRLPPFAATSARASRSRAASSSASTAFWPSCHTAPGHAAGAAVASVVFTTTPTFPYASGAYASGFFGLPASSSSTFVPTMRWASRTASSATRFASPGRTGSGSPDSSFCSPDGPSSSGLFAVSASMALISFDRSSTSIRRPCSPLNQLMTILTFAPFGILPLRTSSSR